MPEVTVDGQEIERRIAERASTSLGTGKGSDMLEAAK